MLIYSLSKIDYLAYKAENMRIVIFFVLVNLCITNSMYSQEIYYLEGSSRKISQLVGDFDNELHVSTSNLTYQNYQIWGTDLGISFQHKGKTYLLFGDIPGDSGFGSDRDPIAYTEDNNPNDGIDLSFIVQSPGLYNPLTIPGISQGAFEVPLDGISINDTMYIYHSTDNMTRSILARSSNDGFSFDLIEDTISIEHFINISVNRIKRSDFPDLPGTFENGLLLLGSGMYRNSAVYLSCQAEDSISFKESMYYFAGYSGQRPLWSRSEEDAVPVIDINCVGELSAAFNPHLQKWLILYNCDDPRGVLFRTSDVPWGPYSTGEILFDPWEDDAYCSFMHVSWEHLNCDSVHDPNRKNEWGGEYGPYMFKEMSVKVDSLVDIYYTLSIWNPYTTVLMKSTLVKPDKHGTGSKSFERNKFHINPNPSSDRFQISSADMVESKLEITLFTSTGSLVISKKYSREIDLSNFPTGIYYGQIIYNNEYHSSFKIVKN